MTAQPWAVPLKGLSLPGGSSLLRGLARLGITTAADLLLYVPRRYEDRREITPISDLAGGSSATISARVTDLRVEKTWRRGVQRTIATLVDDSGAVDAIWYAAGDTSSDFNFYTKRATLAGVFSSTLFYWLNDRSEGDAATWAFLDRRIDDVMRFEKFKGQFAKKAARRG